MSKKIDLAGQHFGLLTVTKYAGPDAHKRATWHCRCDCGGTKTASAGELKKGHVRSCGCLKVAQRKAAAQTQCHAYSRSNWPRERKAWENMLRRCNDPTWKQYADWGGRGITVCERWLNSFQAFADDMGHAPAGGSLERINNALGYSPENCRWASTGEQAANRRSNRMLTFNGKTQNVTKWAMELGIPRARLYQRLHVGWSVERTLTP